MPVIAGSSASCALLLYLGPQEMGARAALANCTSVLCAFVATGSINNNRCVKLDIVQCCIPCVHCICSHDNCKVCLLAYIGQAYSYRSSAFLLTGLKRQSSFDCTKPGPHSSAQHRYCSLLKTGVAVIEPGSQTMLCR